MEGRMQEGDNDDMAVVLIVLMLLAMGLLFGCGFWF